jgi:hypothetical protein
MAKIHPYQTSEVLPQGSLQGGAEASMFGNQTAHGFEALAAGTEHLAHTTYQIKAQEDVTSVHSAMAKAQLDWTNNFAERMKNAQPGDKTLVPQLQKDMAEYLEKMKGTVATREGMGVFERQAGELVTHFTGKAIVGQAELDGAKAVVDWKGMVGSLAATLISDPTGYQNAVGKLDAAINDPNSTYAKLPARAKAELVANAKASLFEGMVRGLIDNGAPELARKKLMDGEGDGVLNEDSKKKLIGEADVGIHNKDVLAKAKIAEEKAAKKEAQEKALDGYMQRIYTPSKENGGTPTYKQIMSDPTIDAAQKQHLAETIRRRAKEAESDKLERNNAEVGRLWGNMIAADGDPAKTFNIDDVRASYRAGKLNFREEMFLEDRFRQLRDGSTNTFERDARGQIDRVSKAISQSPYLTMQPNEVQDTVNRITYDFYSQVEAYRKENKNPRELMNPDSKDYFFSAARVGAYLPSAVASKAADKVREDSRAAPVKYPTWAQYDTLPKGAKYTDPKGVVREKQ